MTVSAPRLAAQCNPFISVDIYTDQWFDQGGFDAFMWDDYEDNSTFCTCTDSLYQSVSWMELPNGTYWNNAENGLTSFLSGPTQGITGNYYALGIATSNSSCFGTIYVPTGWIPILPPPPYINSNGIVEYLTGSTTVYPGDSSYFSIYGAALTAWGETPTPTVTGDSGLTISSVTYASDGQVNVSYTVAAQAAPGQHTVTLMTAPGSAAGYVTVFNCIGQNSVAAEYTPGAVYASGVIDRTTGSLFVPQCSWFTQTAQSGYYSFYQLMANEPAAWGLIKYCS